MNSDSLKAGVETKEIYLVAISHADLDRLLFLQNSKVQNGSFIFISKEFIASALVDNFLDQPKIKTIFVLPRSGDKFGEMKLWLLGSTVLIGFSVQLGTQKKKN